MWLNLCCYNNIHLSWIYLSLRCQEPLYKLPLRNIVNIINCKCIGKISNILIFCYFYHAPKNTIISCCCPTCYKWINIIVWIYPFYNNPEYFTCLKSNILSKSLRIKNNIKWTSIKISNSNSLWYNNCIGYR
jgi:hypothetical protein